jgi:hypothetical protein
LCDPADPEAAEFKQEWLKECWVEMDTTGSPFLRYEDDPEPLPFSALNLGLAWDPSPDGPTARSRNGLLITSLDARGRYAVLKEYAKKESPRKSQHAFFELATTYKDWLSCVVIEEVAFQKILRELVTEEAASRGLSLNIRKVKIPPRQSKEQRQRVWVSNIFERGDGYVRRGLTLFSEEYTFAGVPDSFRDLLDCFGMLTQALKRPLAPEMREFIAMRAREVEIDRGMTGYGTALL